MKQGGNAIATMIAELITLGVLVAYQHPTEARQLVARTRDAWADGIFTRRARAFVKRNRQHYIDAEFRDG